MTDKGLSSQSQRVAEQDLPHMQEQRAEGSLASLTVPPPSFQASSRPATAATSMLTMVPNDDDEPQSEPQQSSVEQNSNSNSAEDDGNSPPEVIVESPPSAEVAPPPIPQTPQISFKFLLVSGRWKIMSFDPASSIARVKELVWNSWQSGMFSVIIMQGCCILNMNSIL